MIFPSFLALVQFDSLTSVLVTIAGLTFIQFTGGSIIEPRLMGTGLNVSPVVMLLSLALWGSIWGVVGMFLAVPMMVVVMIICSNVKATRPIAVLMSASIGIVLQLGKRSIGRFAPAAQARLLSIEWTAQL